MLRTTAFLFATAACALGASLAHAAPVTVINEDMSSGSSAFTDYFVSPDNSDGNLSVQVDANASGGNPGDSITVTHFYDPVASPDGNPSGYSIQSSQLYLPVSWDPGTDGPIDSITFSIDVDFGGNPNGTLAFDVGQGSFGYIAGFQAITPVSGYQTLSATLTEADFASGLDLTAGGPLTFGFDFISHALGNNTDDFPGDQFAADFDNFVVTVNPVPEPASLGLLAAGCLLFFRRR